MPSGQPPSEPFVGEESTDLLPPIQRMRRMAIIGALAGAIVGFGVAAGVTSVASARTVAPATLAEIETQVKSIADTLDSVATAAHVRADRIAINSMVRAAIFTDAATVADMLNSDFEQTPIKDEKLIKGDTLELFQHEGATSTSLVHWPKDAKPLIPLQGRETRLDADGRGGVNVVVSAPVERFKEGEGYRPGITGTIALSIPLDLASQSSKLADVALEVTLGIGTATVPLVHRVGQGGRPIELDVKWKLATLPLKVVPVATRAGWVTPVRYGGLAFGVMMLVVFVVVLRRRLA